MGLATIRKQYGVPAKRGQRLCFTDTDGANAQRCMAATHCTAGPCVRLHCPRSVTVPITRSVCRTAVRRLRQQSGGGQHILRLFPLAGQRG